MKPTRPLFLYDYVMIDRKNGFIDPVPKVTIAVVPRIISDELVGVGIGLTVCSPSENPRRSQGRRYALKHAAAAIRKRRIVKSAAVRNDEPITPFTIGAYYDLNFPFGRITTVNEFLFNANVGETLSSEAMERLERAISKYVARWQNTEATPS